MPIRLTRVSVSGLAIPPGKDEAIFFDSDLKGFGIRLRKAGSKTWIVQYQLHGHKQRRVKIGPLAVFDADQARKIAREILAKAHLGRDPQAEKQAEIAKAKLTLGATIERYLADRADKLRPRTRVELERYLQQWWKPLSAMPLHKITRRDVASHLTGPPMAAARARAQLMGLYAWAMTQGLADSNPVIGTAAAKHKPRERTLDDSELARVWNACQDDRYGKIIKLLILTGCRRQEIGSMAWDELDVEAGTFTIPAERSKNGRAHTLPLPPLAWSIINSVPHVGPLLFVYRGADFGNWADNKRALDQRAKLAKPWTHHDLRRSVATGMAELKVQPHVIEAVLNHVSGHKRGIAGVYNRATYEAEKRTALVLWATHIETLLVPRDGLA